MVLSYCLMFGWCNQCKVHFAPLILKFTYCHNITTATSLWEKVEMNYMQILKCFLISHHI